jgi:hypothetical protein
LTKIKEPLINYWYEALSSPLGTELICSDADKIRKRLYVVRSEVQDPDLDQISVCISTFDPTRLWLVKKRTKE